MCETTLRSGDPVVQLSVYEHLGLCTSEAAALAMCSSGRVTGDPSDCDDCMGDRLASAGLSVSIDSSRLLSVSAALGLLLRGLACARGLRGGVELPEEMLSAWEILLSLLLFLLGCRYVGRKGVNVRDHNLQLPFVSVIRGYALCTPRF
jgi:hypothetical protein